MSKDLIKTEQTAPSFQERLRLALNKKVYETSDGTPFPSDVCLLLDTTGSMDIDDVTLSWGKSDNRRIDKLREAIRGLESRIRRFDYNDDIIELKPTDKTREPRDGNNEELAFETLHRLGFKRVILVTDGGADRPARALKVAKATGLQFDIIYIGPQPAPEFLDDLVKQQASSTLDTKINFARRDGAQLLSAKIKGLLPAPKTGAIQL